MLTKDLFLFLKVTKITLVASAVALQLIDLIVKIEKLTVLVTLLDFELTQFPFGPNLLIEGGITIRHGLIDALRDLINVIHLLLQVVCHALIFSAGALKTTFELVNAAFFHTFSLQIVSPLL